MSNELDKPPVPPVDSGSQALAEALQSSFVIVKYVMAGLFVLFLFSGLFKVEPQQKAIVLRFGKPVGEGEKALLGSGLHWAWPYPIDDVVKIPITEIQEVTARAHWFYQTPEKEASNEDPPAGPSLNPAIDGYALTGDGNIVHTKATLSYRIEDPVRCVFEFASGTNQTYGLAGVSNAVMNALNNALVYTAARFRVDDLLLSDRIGFQDAVKRRVVQLIAGQKLGVVVDNCSVQSRAPRQLKLAFDSVITAGQKSRTEVTKALTYENEVTNRASSEVVGRLNAAETDSKRLVDSVTADAENFRRLLPKYQANPDLFVQQRLVETMGRVFASAQDKMFLPTSTDGKPIELRLLLNRELPKQKTEEAKP